MGLALTKHLVDLHGGTIEVTSTEGIGTVFTVRIPMQGRVANASQEPLAQPQRILLIEHHEETANLICDVLTAAGYPLVWMLEGSTAVSQIETFRPSLVITNARLPDIDGDRLIRMLPQNPTTKQLRIVALVPTEESVVQLELEADDWLAQLVRPDHLLQKLMNAMNTKD